MSWRLPTETAHRIAASAGTLTFVGGAGDHDGDGRIRSPGDLLSQAAGAMENVDRALAAESSSLRDVVRLKGYYRSDGSVDEASVHRAMAACIDAEPLPVISLHPVPVQAWEGQEIQVQAIAVRGWREGANVRFVTRTSVSASGETLITEGLRAGELIALHPQTALGTDGAVLAPGDSHEQTRIVMSRLEQVLGELGASLQDGVKKEGYYFGVTMDEWAPMAAIRASFFREPGPVATVVPCQALWPAGALTKVEVLALRARLNTFDKYIPRGDSWPERVWDWPIPVPYRQGIRLRDAIWLGGQVALAPYGNEGAVVHKGDVQAQARLCMSYIEDLLGGFGRGTDALALLVCYFRSAGGAAETERFVRTLAECVSGPLPPLTLVPQPALHSEDMTVEIWGVARG